MSVSIEPSELGFRRPLTAEVSETLRIKNPNSFPVAFKVKTTAPKQYCVRPNSGRIEADREVEVSVLLQAMRQEPPDDYKCRDKFLVQSVAVTGNKEFFSAQDLWDRVEKADVQEKKIRVTFLPSKDADHPAVSPVTPVRGLATSATADTVLVVSQNDATPDLAPPAYTSAREEPHSKSDVSAADLSVLDKHITTPQKSVDEDVSISHKAGFGGQVTPAGDKDTTIATLTARLAESEALITSLRKDGLKQRRSGTIATGTSEKAAAVGEDTQTATTAAPQLSQVSRQGTEGVSVQVTAILCFISFLLAYFFF